jgi:hypothetical protein
MCGSQLKHRLHLVQYGLGRRELRTLRCVSAMLVLVQEEASEVGKFASVESAKFQVRGSNARKKTSQRCSVVSKTQISKEAFQQSSGAALT